MCVSERERERIVLTDVRTVNVALLQYSHYQIFHIAEQITIFLSVWKQLPFPQLPLVLLPHLISFPHQCDAEDYAVT